MQSTRVVIADPKAVTHFYSKETFDYVKTSQSKSFVKRVFGRGLLWAEGESHRRQRKALSPAFSNGSIHKLTSVFYNLSYKLKDNWDAILGSSAADGAVIDVQKWMNHVSLDSIGIAGFGHDFGSLDGKVPSLIPMFEAINSRSSPLSLFIFMLGPILPFLFELPTSESRQWSELHGTMEQIADDLLKRTRKEHEELLCEEEKSIIALLIKAESTDTPLRMSKEEVLAQNTMLVAGYETTSISLTWALIELARNPGKQQKLREELSRFSMAPTWEQLVSELPYLDSVVQEVLRLHPPFTDIHAVAAENDIIPLSTPVLNATGEIVSSIVVQKGTLVSVPIRAINRSTAFWGPDAKEFEPERWLVNLDVPAKQFPGHHHILTFSNGPRMCLGRRFALAEFKVRISSGYTESYSEYMPKAVLFVLIRNFAFELLDGPETKIEKHRSMLPRPKVAGQIGAKVPMRVMHVA
ncbi:hypothetical protein C0993_008238 [Termitomyces sp. T159_Od127]|nr:hypothetical protein C0993_008238 [Termitomyces sp. T159_Od127]